MISGAFSIVKQSIALGCFPRLDIKHTSAVVAGQIYIPVGVQSLLQSCTLLRAVRLKPSNCHMSYMLRARTQRLASVNPNLVVAWCNFTVLICVSKLCDSS